MGTEKKNTIKVIFFKATIVFSKQLLYFQRLLHTHQPAMCRMGVGQVGERERQTLPNSASKVSGINKLQTDDTQEGQASGTDAQNKLKQWLLLLSLT